jgi:hypothetical protein
MSWVGLASGVMSLVNWVSRYVERRQQRQDGKNEALVEQFNEREKRRRLAAGAVPIKLSQDEHNRDR